MLFGTVGGCVPIPVLQLCPYGWSHPHGKANTDERFVAVLELPPVDSAESAVKVGVAYQLKKANK